MKQLQKPGDLLLELVKPSSTSEEPSSSSAAARYKDASGISSLDLRSTSSAQSLAPISLMQLLGPQPPRFPTFLELIRQQTKKETPATTERRGLFKQLLGEPSILYNDLLDDPDKYEDGVAQLLLLLIGGKTSLDQLTMKEHHLLDRATLDFNRATDKKPRSLTSQLPKPLPTTDSGEEPDIEYHEHMKACQPPMPAHEPDQPLSGNSSFWWKK